MKLRGKKNWQNHVSEIISLDWSVNSFHAENFFVSIRQEGKQALGLYFSFHSFLDIF